MENEIKEKEVLFKIDEKDYESLEKLMKKQGEDIPVEMYVRELVMSYLKMFFIDESEFKNTERDLNILQRAGSEQEMKNFKELYFRPLDEELSGKKVSVKLPNSLYAQIVSYITPFKEDGIDMTLLLSNVLNCWLLENSQTLYNLSCSRMDQLKEKLRKNIND